MKKLTLFLFIATFCFTVTGNAQVKIGHIDMTAVIIAMPEYKKADTALADYQNALSQQYADMVQDFNKRDSLLASKDTLKFTRAQLEVKRRDLGQLYLKLQGWNQQAQQLYASKESELLAPVQRKAQNTVDAVAKENGYSYVFNRNSLAVTPPVADDLLPLVKRKLGLR